MPSKISQTPTLIILATAALAAHASASIIDITQPGVTMQQVLGNQFIVGDKLFTVPGNGFQSVAFNPSQVFISALVNADPLSGQGFRLTGSFLDTPGGPGSDFVLLYSIEVRPEFISQGYRITDADLRFNGSATGDGSFARVDESLIDVNNHLVANKSVFAYGDGKSHLEDHTEFDGVTRLDVVKDVQFLAAGDGGTASASFVDQEFSQTIIPLPAPVWTGGLGLAALAIRLRRR